MDRVGEVISRVERRRRWTAEQKIKVLTEALEPGGHSIGGCRPERLSGASAARRSG
jgi:transposase-like protein